ncbi:MAG: hypothetical protein ACPGVT_03325 [Maricaulaceae bacterium]
MTFKETLPMWWSFAWRGTLAGAVLGLVFGMFAGLLAALSGNPDSAGQWGSYAGTIAGIPASMWAFYATINKHELFKRIDS